MSAGIHLVKVQRKDSFLSATNFCANLEPRTRRGARAYSPLRSRVSTAYWALPRPRRLLNMQMREVWVG